ncbi:hypothetical protein A3Q56_02069 [Intoshia linei]|uniref:Uncharacterized protein n=1 Tax=Intoshia linei TaxID=1819745 RepID=A0A177B9G7_9BILA|nr:hypothetical protein A3Q56_02069 [Intoshia linei]
MNKTNFAILKDPQVNKLFNEQNPEKIYKNLREIGHGSFGNQINDVIDNSNIAENKELEDFEELRKDGIYAIFNNLRNYAKQHCPKNLENIFIGKQNDTVLSGKSDHLPKKVVTFRVFTVYKIVEITMLHAFHAYFKSIYDSWCAANIKILGNTDITKY